MKKWNFITSIKENKMIAQYIPLTQKEMFFGTTPAPIQLSTGSAISTQAFTPKFAPAAANATIIQSPSLSPLTNSTPLPQAEFALSDFLWQYRWEIGMGMVVITAGYLIYYNEQEKKKRMGM